MYIKSVSGTEVFKSEYQIHDSINGIPTIELDYTQLSKTHTEPIYFLSKAWNDRFAMIIKEEESIADSKRVKFTGVHAFIYDFKASRIYDTYTQYFALENILGLIFDDTGYQFEVSGDTQYYVEHFQNFGNKDKMALFNQVLDRWGLEFHVRGTTVFISDARGEETTRQFRYKMNITNSKVNLDVSEGATYIRGFFGRKPEPEDENQTDTSFEREMTHALADTYGIRHAAPYSNQNITTVETADAYLKQRLEDTWKLSIEIDVIDLGANETVSVGDVVWAIDERLDLKFKTRIVELVSHYNADDEIYKQVAILGNQTLINDMFANEVTAQDLVEEVEQSVNKQIEDSQAEFDNNFNQLRDEIQSTGQSVLDQANANVDALEEAMGEEFTTQYNTLYGEIQTAADATWQQAQNAISAMDTDMTERFDIRYTELQAEIQTTANTTLQQAQNSISEMETEMEEEFSGWSEDLTQLRNDYIASMQDMTDITDTLTLDLNGVEDTVNGMQVNVTTVLDDVSNIQDFIGDTSTNLNEQLQEISVDFNERIDNINVNTRNMFRGTRFDEGQFTLVGGAQLHTDESIYYADIGSTTSHFYPEMDTEITIVEGQRYKFSADIRTNDLDGLNYFVIWAGSDFYRVYDINGVEGVSGLIQDGLWHRYTKEFVATKSITGTLQFRGRGNTGSGHIRLMYLTQSNNTEWLPHPLDHTQSIEEVTRRITELETGRNELITRTEYNADTEVLGGTIKEITETVEESSTTITNHEEWFVTNGSNVLQTVDEVSSKVWTTDIASIQPNLIPQSANSWVNGRYWSSGSLADGGASANHISLERSLAMRTGSQVAVTMSDESSESSSISHWLVYFTNANGTIFSGEDAITVPRGQTRTFTVPEGSTRVLVSAISDGTNINPSWIEQPNRRINVKLEVGETATPMMGFMSNVEQLSNRVATTVYGTDGLEGTVAQHVVEVGTIRGIATDADGKASEALQTADGFSNTVATHENWFEENGSNVLQTVDEVTNKVWTTDIANIRPNLIPQSSNAWVDGRYWSSGSLATAGSYANNLSLSRDSAIEVGVGATVTLSDESVYLSVVDRWLVYFTNADGTMFSGENAVEIPRGETRTMTVPGDSTHILVTAMALDGFGVNASFIDNPNKRIKVKLEIGANATPMMGFMSNVEQLSNRVSTTVYGTDGLDSTVAQHVVKIGEIEGLVSDAEGNASQALQTVNGFENRVTSAEGNASEALQTVNGFSNTVTSLSDSVNANVNLLPHIYSSWEIGSINSDGTLISGNNRMRMKNHIPIENTSNLYYSGTSTIYQISLRFYDENKNPNGWTSSWITRNSVISVPSGTRFIKVVFRRSNDATFTIGTWINNTKLEVGDKHTESIGAISQLEQRADAIALTVQDIDLDGVIRQSDVSVEPTGVTIGSAYLGENQLASMFRVMPNAIEAITEEMRLHGDLSVTGDIKGFAIEAVKADFGSVNSEILISDVIKAEHIEVDNALIEKMFVEDLLVDKLTAEDGFIANMEALSVEAVKADFGSVNSEILTSDVIKAEHIEIDNALIEKMFVEELLVDKLTAEEGFIQNTKALSVEAVTSSFGEVYADFIEGLYTKTEYLEAFDAEVKRAFIKEAAIEELFAHDATIQKLEAIDLTANQIRIAFNDISPNVQIDNQSMEFYDGANRVSRLDRYGSRFYQEGVQVGQIGPTKIVGTNHLGLRFFLPEESEYMSWEVASSSAGVGSPKLIWSRGNEGYSWKAGFTFTDPVRVPGIIPVSATHDAERLYITSSSTVESGNGRATVLQLNNVDDASIPSGNIRGGSDIIFKPGTTHVRASAYGRVATLALASNSTRNVLTSNAAYEFTTTDAANYLTINSDWQFRRLTSSKKYKYHNKFIDAVTASKLLEINPATWFDKTAVDDYTNELNDNYDGVDKDEIEQKGYVKEKIKPVPGLYAEDVRDAGLEDFVTYNEDGEVDGINQNLWVLLIPLVKELKSEIKELKEQLK